MGTFKCKYFLSAALVLCQAAMPAGAMETGTARVEESKAPAAPAASSLEQRLGDLAAGHLKTLAEDNQRRMSGYSADLSLLHAGVFYGNAYAGALKAKGQTQRFNFMRDKGHFYHGLASPKHFTQPASLISATGKQPSTFQLKPGVAPTTALDSFGTGLALMDCGSVAMLSYFQALRGVLGEDKFNAVFAAESRTPLRICPQLEAGNPITCLFRPVAPEAPFKRGQFLSFAGVPGYQLKHINGEATNFNVICDDAATPGSERFVGLGLSGHGADRNAIREVFVEEYNADPVGWDIFPEAVAARIRRTYPPPFLAMAESLANATTSVAEFEKQGGMTPHNRFEFKVERVAALVAATPEEAQTLLAAWNR